MPLLSYGRCQRFQARYKPARPSGKCPACVQTFTISNQLQPSKPVTTSHATEKPTQAASLNPVGSTRRRMSACDRGLVAVFVLACWFLVVSVAQGGKEAHSLPKVKFDSAVVRLTGVTSKVFKIRGFKGYAFGKTKADVENLTRLVGPVVGTEQMTRPGLQWLANREGEEFCFANDQLRGYGRRYSNEIEAIQAKLAELFGPATKQNTYAYSFQNKDSPQFAINVQQTVVYHYFPQTVACVFTSSSTRLQGGAKRTHVNVLVLDRDWFMEVLESHALAKRKAWTWMKAVMNQTATAQVDLGNLPPFAGTYQDTFQSRNHNAVLFSDEKRPKPPARQKGERFCLGVITLTKSIPEAGKKGVVADLRELFLRGAWNDLLLEGGSKGKIEALIDARLLPSYEAHPLWQTVFSQEFVRLNMLLALEYCPPQKGTLRLIRRQGYCTYEWRTKSGWFVNVGRDNNVLLVKSPIDL